MSETTPPPSGWEPLYLSTIAGLSTCIGAAVVFCQPQHHDESNTKIVPPKTMAFSLALAGSVMVTVSVVSILPEVLMDDNAMDAEGAVDGYRMIAIFSWEMIYRILFFSLGCGLYFGLSLWLHVPEPDEMLDQVLQLDSNSKNSKDDADIIDIELTSLSLTSKETEMLLHDEQQSTSDGPARTSSPLRERKKQQLNTQKRSESPGSLNGKVKSPLEKNGPNNSTTTTDNTLSFGAWTTGEDLGSNEKKKAWRVAILLFVSLLVHNFPEGLAVAASALESSKLGMFLHICFVLLFFFSTMMIHSFFLTIPMYIYIYILFRVDCYNRYYGT